MTSNERLASLETKVGEINKTTWKIHDAVYGNGKPGILAELHAIRRARVDIKWLVSTVVAIAALVIAYIK